MTTGNQDVPQLICTKHTQRLVRYVCCVESCGFGNLICDQCMNADPRHFQQHKSNFVDMKNFFTNQTNTNTKLMPSIADQINELGKLHSEYMTHIEAQTSEIEKDFANIFKIFFNVSERAKTFLKDVLRGEGKKFSGQLQELGKRLSELTTANKKEGENIFSLLFTRNSGDETYTSSSKVTEETVSKIVKKNAPLNKIRLEAYSLSQELEKLKANKVVYKQSDESQQLYNKLEDSFTSNLKDMYKQFKGLIEGVGDDDMRSSIFAGMKPSASLTSLSNSIVMNKNKPPIITIDLSNSQSFSSSPSPSSNSLKQSIILLKQDTEKRPPKILRKIEQFPSLTNELVKEAIRANGSYSFKLEDSNNQQPEQGPFELEDGSVYYGQIQGSMRHGKGKAIFSDGACYEGFWKDDIPNGNGRIIRSNGDVYQGQCINFKANGKGVFKYLSGDYLYTGDWVDDQRHGKGEEIIPSKYKYVGDFSENLKHGIGQMIFTDKSIYSGEFTNGQITGEGTFDYENGEKFVGQLLNGQKQGKGAYVWPDGSSFDGDYHNNLPHGKGIFIWSDGYIYNGCWREGLQHGAGQEINPEGDERQGEWENGVWSHWVSSSQ